MMINTDTNNTEYKCDREIKLVSIPLDALCKGKKSNKGKSKNGDDNGETENEPKVERKKATKVQNKIWNLSAEQKTPDFQHQLMTDIYIYFFQEEINANTKANIKALSFFAQEVVKLLKIKRHSYKSQDLIKKKWDEKEFITINDIIQLLQQSQLLCVYCNECMYVLYEFVCEPKQWTLDRIDNQKGHNSNNVVISCLECNLKRRITNKNKFQMGKKIVISKIIKECDGGNNNDDDDECGGQADGEVNSSVGI